MKRTLVAVLAATLLAGSASAAAAAPITLAPLDAGDGIYYLMFVTHGTTRTIETDIAYYDAFVNTEAALNPELAVLGTEWRVVGSTATVRAEEHVNVSGPVYLLDGVQFAADAAALFHPTADHRHLRDTPFTDQLGDVLRTRVWTGGNWGVNYLGNTSVNAGLDTIYGWSGGSSFFLDWLAHGDGNGEFGTPQSLYAISGPLVHGHAAPVPEPGTLSLLLTSASLVLMRVRLRRPHARVPA